MSPRLVPLRLGLVVVAMATLLLAVAGSAGAAVLYLPQYGSGPPETIAGYSLGADGTPAPLTGSPFAVGPSSGNPSGVVGLAFTPDGTRAITSYLFHGGFVSALAAEDGSLTPRPGAVFTASVTGLAVSPDGRFAYGTTREFGGVPASAILGFKVLPSGVLEDISGSPFGSGEYEELAITPDQRFLFASEGSDIDRFTIAPDGELVDEVDNVAEGDFLQVSPDGHLLLAGESSALRSYTIGIDGSLTQAGEPLIAPGASFGFFSVAADGRHVYVPDRNGSAIVTVAIGADGSLGVAGSTPIKVPVAVFAPPDGAHLYIASSEEESLRVAAIGAGGMLTLLPGKAPWDSNEPERIVPLPSPAPTAAFAVRAATAGSATSFDAGASGAARYEWSFGDGTALRDGGPTPEHTYADPGSYTAKLTVYDDLGCSSAEIYTGQTTVCPGGNSQASSTVDVAAAPPPKSAQPPSAPTITSFTLTRSRFAVSAPRRSKHKLGTTFVYGLDAAAKVNFTIERPVPGRTVAGHCVKPNPKNQRHRRCARNLTDGSLPSIGTAGENRFAFDGRVSGKLLKPGSYRVTAVATDSSGTSAPRTQFFRVLPPPSR
jgi:PKD repeat protein